MVLKPLGVCLAALLLAIAPAAADVRSLDDLQAMVAGVGTEGRILAAAVALTSGPWGTDYLTVSHTFRAARTFGVTMDGKVFAPSTPIAACSSQYHGIDALVLRVPSHPSRPVLQWGDSASLQPGEELLILPRPELYPGPVKVRFVHINYLQWRQVKPEDIGSQWHNAMVGDGLAKPGFSGSPWVKDGRVYGLVKGGARPRGSRTVYVLAESATRLQVCLTQLHYQELIPQP